jgi:hypothetical protein
VLKGLGNHLPQPLNHSLEYWIAENGNAENYQARTVAYCLANNIPSETKLKFSSGEASLQRLRSLGFQAERLQN